METKHTKGPWYFDETATELLITTADKSAICEMFIGDGFGGLRNYIANAKLIAAAPALLEACKDVRLELELLHTLAQARKEEEPLIGIEQRIAQVNHAIALAEKGE